jgi:NDP-sugar pyrophosphorylase family protein
MQAVILAGGLGTRLKPITEQIPKGMVLVNRKPFLFHLLQCLKSDGIDDIILCTGHLGEKIIDYFKDGSKMGIGIRYSRENKKLLGTAGALKKAGPLLNDHFFVINGDTYLPIDYKSVEKSFMTGKKRALMVVYDNSNDTGVSKNVGLAADKSVKRYAKGVADGSLKYVEAGVLVFKKDVLDTIATGETCSIENAIYQPLIKLGEITAFITDQRFYDIGTPQQLKIFKAYLKKN